MGIEPTLDSLRSVRLLMSVLGPNLQDALGRLANEISTTLVAERSNFNVSPDRARRWVAAIDRLLHESAGKVGERDWFDVKECVRDELAELVSDLQRTVLDCEFPVDRTAR